MSEDMNEDMNEILAAMFPEFEATKSFQMSWSKSMYVVNHGLAPYFKSVLKTNLHKADFLVYSFDESQWRYANNRNGLACALLDLLNHFKSITNDFPSNKVYQVSMDRPNVI